MRQTLEEKEEKRKEYLKKWNANRSEEKKQAKREYLIKWRSENKDKCKQYTLNRKKKLFYK